MSLNSNGSALWPAAFATLFWVVACAQSIVWRSYVVSAQRRPVSVSFIVKAELVMFGIALLLTPAILAVVRRFPLRRGNWSAPLVHLATGVTFGLTLKLLWDIGILPLYQTPWIVGAFTWQPFIQSVFAGLQVNVLLYWLLIIGLTTVDLARRERNNLIEASLLRAQLAEARLEALRVQLDPHFLFNTLNSISALVHSDPDTAELMIASLSELLRHSLDPRSRSEIPLREEIAFLRLYVDIQCRRFEARLQVRFEMEPGTDSAMVPSMVLQPLVENSIRHGIAHRRAGGTVVVRASRAGAKVVLEVEDLVGAPVAAPLEEGIGLRNTRERLERMYGAAQRMELMPGSAGLIARVRLPYHTEAALASGHR